MCYMERGIPEKTDNEREVKQGGEVQGESDETNMQKNVK